MLLLPTAQTETLASLLPLCPVWEGAERRSRLGKKGFVATAYLLSQPRERKAKEKEDQRRDVSLKLSLATFLRRCCHLCCTTPAPVGTSACHWDPTAGNEFPLILRQKQL